MNRILILTLLLCAGIAHADSRVAVVGFKGPAAAKTRAAFARELCSLETCVKPGRRGKKTAVDAVVTGKVIRVRTRAALELKIYTTSEDPPVQVRVPLKKPGVFSPRALARAVAAVRSALEASESHSESGDDNGNVPAGTLSARAP